MIKKSSVSAYDREKWWMSDINECSLTDECQIWAHTLKTLLKIIQWLKNDGINVWQKTKKRGLVLTAIFNVL